MHPIDREYAYCQLPQTGDYSRDALNLRAADFYRSTRIVADSRWSGYDDLRPQLAEFDHLVKGRAYDDAAVLLKEFGPDMIWGGFTTSGSRMIEMLRGRLHTIQGRVSLLLCDTSRAALLGPLDSAIELGVETRNLAAELGESRTLARASYLVSEAHRTMGHAVSAIPFLEEAAEVFGRLEDYESRDWCVFRLSLCYTYAGRLDEAARMADQLWRFVQQRDGVESLGLVHSALALATLAAGEMDLAIAHGRAALEAWGRDDDRPGGYVRHMLGLAYLRQQEFEQAVMHLESAREVARAIEQPRLEGLARYHLAVSYYLQGDLALAERAAGQAAALLKAMNIDAAPSFVASAIHAAARNDRHTEIECLLDAATASHECADLYPPAELAMLAAKRAADCADPQLLRKAVAAQEVADSRIIRPDQWPAWAAGIRPSRPVVESPGAVDNAE